MTWGVTKSGGVGAAARSWRSCCITSRSTRTTISAVLVKSSARGVETSGLPAAELTGRRRLVGGGGGWAPASLSAARFAMAERRCDGGRTEEPGTADGRPRFILQQGSRRPENPRKCHNMQPARQGNNVK